jgi:drug/metabolite transporter (DMT)-like permease
VLTVLAGLGSALGYALHDYLMVKVVRAVSVWTALTWAMAAATAVLLPLALLVDGVPSGAAESRAVLFALGSGLLEVAGLAALLRGLVTGNLSVVAPLACLSGGFAAAAVIVAGETLSAPGYAGVALAVAGGLLASIERPEGAGPARARATAGAGWALLSALLFALTFLFIAGADELPPLSMAAIGRTASVVTLVPLAALTGGLRLPAELRLRTVGAGLFDGAAFVLLAVAITVGPLAIASVTAAQSGTMAALLGLALLRERLTRLQLVGVALTLVAVTVLAVV